VSESEQKTTLELRNLAGPWLPTQSYLAALLQEPVLTTTAHPAVSYGLTFEALENLIQDY
jgi:hypothetical protein